MTFKDIFSLREFKEHATLIPKDEYLSLDPQADIESWIAPPAFWKRHNGNYHTYKGNIIPTMCTLEWCIHTANYYSNKPKFHTTAMKKFMLLPDTTLQAWAIEANCDVTYLMAAIITSKYKDTPVGVFASKEINKLK